MAREIRDGLDARARSWRRRRTSTSSLAVLRRASARGGRRHRAAAPGRRARHAVRRPLRPDRAPRATDRTGPVHAALQSPDGTMAGSTRTRSSRSSPMLALREAARVTPRLSVVTSSLERGGAAARLPGERGLGGRDRRGRRGVARQDRADRARVHGPGVGAAVARLRRAEELRARPGHGRLDPLARRRRARVARAARRDPRDPERRRAGRRLLDPRDGTSSGGAGSVTAASIPTGSSGCSGAGAGASWSAPSTSR